MCSVIHRHYVDAVERAALAIKQAEAEFGAFVPPVGADAVSVEVAVAEVVEPAPVSAATPSSPPSQYQQSDRDQRRNRR
jgi:hypothetical protein